MEIAAFVVSLAALALAGFGTYLSDRRSRQALAETREAKSETLWSEAIAAAHRVMVDPTTHDMGEPMQSLRIAMSALADAHRDSPGFDRWLAAEHVLGSHVAQMVLAGGPPQPGFDARTHFERVKPFINWGVVLSGNLRHMRDVGVTPEAIREVRENTWTALVATHAEAGMGLPPADLDPNVS